MTKKNILFIPFSAEEGFSLYLRALEWRYNFKKINALEKIPDVIMYRDSNLQDESYEGYDVQFNLTEDNCPLNTTIYVLADGIGDPTLVSNVNNYFYKAREIPHVLSVEAIVSRMKKSGLSSKLAQNLNAIKLFICEEDNTNEQLAINFAHELGADFNTLPLHYYNAELFIPQVTQDNKTKKWGNIYITGQDGKRQLIDSGVASEYRYTITVQEALQQEKTRVNDEEEPLESFASLTIDEVEIDGVEIIPYVSSKIEVPDDSSYQERALTRQSQERQIIVYSSKSWGTFFHPQRLQEENKKPANEVGAYL